MKTTKEKPLVTVRVINYKLLAQVYHTRGELDSTPDRLNENEIAVGCLVNGAGIVIHDTKTNRVRLAWNYRFAIGQGLSTNANDGSHRALFESLPQIFIEGGSED